MYYNGGGGHASIDSLHEFLWNIIYIKQSYLSSVVFFNFNFLLHISTDNIMCVLWKRGTERKLEKK